MDLSTLNDADFLHATRALAADPPTRIKPCMVCGDPVEVTHQVRRVKCPKCKDVISNINYKTAAPRIPHGRIRLPSLKGD